MRYALILLVIIIALLWYGKSLSDRGEISPLVIKYLPEQAPAIEYYWADIAALVNNTPAARYHYDIVITTFAASPYCPDALIGRARAYENSDRAFAVNEYKNILEKYPGHPKATKISKRLEMLLEQ
jgi:outer membrane protein assembly factor BamD (BamD/ComL family)